MKEERDNDIQDITEMYETKVRTLKTELDDGSQQLQTLMDEKVNLSSCIAGQW